MLFLSAALALAGCSGERGPAGAPGQDGANGVDGTNGQNGQDGATGPTGQTGPTGPAGQDLTAVAKPESCAVCHPGDGAAHQAIYSQYTDATKLSVAVNGVASVANGDGTFTSTMTITITGADGLPLVTPALLKQKRFSAVEYVPASRTFKTATAFDFSSLTATATAGQYTVKNVAAKFAPEAAANAFVYGYVATGTPIVTPAGHYNLYPDVYNFGQALAVDYTSAANVAACEKCHGAPYRKHGYRMAVVPGLNDFVGCKACHTDQRPGTDFVFQILADDPVAAAALVPDVYTPEQEAKYAYYATVMQDTHQSHAMEFAYPQSMANCVTCHAGKLGMILTDANFTVATCKSCHPVTGPATPDTKRAPALKTLMTAASFPHTGMDPYTYTGNCNDCHKAGGAARAFGLIHAGFDKAIYSDATTKYSSVVKADITSISFASATNTLTVNFGMTGAAANAIVKPTVVISLYGYGTKDFIVTGHGSQPAPDGKRNLEWAEGSTSNSPRLTVVPGATAGTFTATADLTLWAGLLADGSVKKAEIGVLPVIGLDQAAVVSATNPAIAAAGATKTFDLVGNGGTADAYGKDIVDASKCNACHAALGTTFHSPSYGSAGVVACRLCHVTLSGGSHLEMQSRSIDSYVHAIHSYQVFDVKNVDFADPVAAMKYSHHTESTYPNFTILNCESCHNPGTYDVPAQNLSLPGILSAAAVIPSKDRAIGAVPSRVTGAASRACGSCHRAEMINEDDAAGLAAFDEHTAANGFMLPATAPLTTTDVLNAAIAKIMAIFK